MKKFRFRKTIDIDVEADTEEDARQQLVKTCSRGEGVLGSGHTFELLGTVETQKLNPDEEEFAEKLGEGYIVMSVQFRGENFACLCTIEELDPEHVSVRPRALLLREEQKEHITDVMGEKPTIRKQE